MNKQNLWKHLKVGKKNVYHFRFIEYLLRMATICVVAVRVNDMR